MTHQQQRLLAFIAAYQNDNSGVSPSFDEMKEGLGLKSKSGIHRLLTGLEERGHLRRTHHHARTITIITEGAECVTVDDLNKMVHRLAKQEGADRAASALLDLVCLLVRSIQLRAA